MGRKNGMLLFLVVVGLMVWSSGHGALAAEYPSETVKYTIPWPPGGRTDLTSRMIAPYLSKYLGVPVTVINKVGGAGVVGMSHVRDAAPDGYTVSQGGQSLVMAQYEKPGFLSIWDYTWIARIYWTPVVLAVKAKSPFKNMKELMDYARANPGKLRHGNTGTGSTTHLACERFAKQFGVKITQVPYRGEGPAVIGLGGGEVDMAFGLMVAFRPLRDEGKVRIIGVAGEKRNPLYPDVPTLREQGVDYTEMAFETIHTPRCLPKNVYDKLFDACRKTLTDPELVKKFGKVGLNMSYQSGPEFVKFMKGFNRRTRDLIYDLGVQLKKK
jgi:tripartite-type tricarboxylate transporter receptor subunit TctC